MKERFNDVEGELEYALRREEPPAGFAERVLSRVGERPAARLPFVQWAAAAALVAAVAGGFDYIGKQEQRAEGEAAKERVVLALHIAGTKLQLVQTKINRIHEEPVRNSNQ
jgi:hypothetical protein